MPQQESYTFFWGGSPTINKDLPSRCVRAGRITRQAVNVQKTLIPDAQTEWVLHGLVLAVGKVKG